MAPRHNPIADNKTMNRGRPPTNPIDRLRAKLWYWAVRSRPEWNDYRLDIEFVREEQEEKRRGVDRRRAFGRIGRHGIVPSSGNHHGRHYDLIARVDAHPEFAGTAAVFRSSFWDLLKADVMRLSEAQAFVSRCMAVSGVYRPSGQFEMVLRNTKAWSRLNLKSYQIYAAAIRAVLATKPLDLDTLSLVGGLYREAYLACALEIAVVLQDTFLELLRRYCGQQWLEPLKKELFEIAKSRVLHWQVDVEFSTGRAPYDTWPAHVIQRPLYSVDDPLLPDAPYRDVMFDEMMQDFIESIRGDE